MQQFSDEQPDELDRLFTRLEPAAPPSDLMARVLARTETVRQPSPWSARLTTAAYLVALALLGALTYQIGQGLTLSGAGDLLEMALNEPEVALEAPSAYLLGIAELLPWSELAAALALAAIALLALRSLGQWWSLREDLEIG